MPETNVCEWLVKLQKDVIEFRPKVRYENNKRKKRFQLTVVKQKVQPTIQLSLNDYLPAFQLELDPLFVEPFRGDLAILDAFQQEWQNTIQNNVSQTDASLQKAVEIMTEDVEEMIEQLSSINYADEEVDNKIKTIILLFIERVIYSIRDGWPTNPVVYEQLLLVVHRFFSQIGVYTLTPQVGDVMDYDTIEPVVSTQNITEDSQLDGTLKEIQLYPYMYAFENLPFILGKAIVWRKG